MSSIRLVVSISEQVLRVEQEGEERFRFPVSTALAGVGTEAGSYKTPVGRFRIAEKIGGGCPAGTVFRSRVPAELWIPQDREEMEDLITSRILWLDGLEEGNANTKSRYIYIHGTNHEDKLGTPVSCGCIRMGNEDIMLLFDLVEEGDLVEILD